MRILILICWLLSTLLLADNHNNLFIIKDQDGKVVKDQKIKHSNNKFFEGLIEEQKMLLAKLQKLKSKKKGQNDYDKNPIIYHAKSYIGGRYVWGGTHPEGFDCSGYVKYLYEKEGISLPRTAYEQSKVGKEIPRYALEKGDLVFFKTTEKRNIPITHVGMYIGNDQFIHAASKKDGIIVSSLSKSKYNNKFVKATRIIR